MKVKLNKYRVKYRLSNHPNSGDQYYFVYGLHEREAEQYLSHMQGRVRFKIEKMSTRDFSFPELKFMNEAQRDGFYDVLIESDTTPERVLLYNKITPIERKKVKKLLNDLIRSSILLGPEFLADIFSVRISFIKDKLY